MRSDASMVTLLREGNEEAFSLLYRKYASKMYHVCRKMGLGHEDAEGVVQDVFITVWRTRTSLDDSLSFNAYLISIVRSMVIKYFKKRLRSSAYQQYITCTSSGLSNDTEDYIIFTELDEWSSRMIERLPASQKQVFMMKNKENLSTEEIARKLNISKRTVENQVYRATKWLKEKLAL